MIVDLPPRIFRRELDDRNRDLRVEYARKENAERKTLSSGGTKQDFVAI